MLTATVDLPTPPFPDAIAIVCLTPGRISEGFGRMNAGRTLAVIRTSTSATPGMSPTRSWAWVLKRSRTGHAGVVSSKVKLTLPCGVTSSSLIMPRLTTSRPRSGSLILPNASRTCCEVGELTVRDVTEAAKFSAPMNIEGPPRNHGEASGFVGTKDVTATSPMSELVAYYGGPASDVYFQRARKTLAGAKVDA